MPRPQYIWCWRPRLGTQGSKTRVRWGLHRRQKYSPPRSQRGWKRCPNRDAEGKQHPAGARHGLGPGNHWTTGRRRGSDLTVTAAVLRRTCYRGVCPAVLLLWAQCTWVPIFTHRSAGSCPVPMAADGEKETLLIVKSPRPGLFSRPSCLSMAG